jgi:hypothetical protein
MLLMHFWKASTSVAMGPGSRPGRQWSYSLPDEEGPLWKRQRGAAYSFTAPVSEET